MDKKICELKLDDIKSVVGGLYTSTLFASLIKSTSTVSSSSLLIQPTSTTTVPTSGTLSL